MPEKTLNLKYSSIEELEKKADFSAKHAERSTDALTKSISKLKSQSEKCNSDDPEKAFINYFRCISFITMLKERRDFTENKNYYDAMYRKEWCEIYKEYVNLRNLLVAEYEKKQKQDRVIVGKPRGQSAILEPPEVEKIRLNGIEKSIKKEPEHSISLSCSQLFNESKKMTPRGLLIIDIRPESDFKESRMRINDLVNVPDELFKNSLLSEIETDINEEFRHHFKLRRSYEKIVVLDWNTEETELSATNLVFLMLEKINKWDAYSNPYKCKPNILNGGYACWINCYPHLTTNSSVKPPPKKKWDKIICSYDNVAYPTDKENEDDLKAADMAKLPLITTKEISIPGFDRSKKPKPPKPHLTELVISPLPAFENSTPPNAAQLSETLSNLVLDKRPSLATPKKTAMPNGTSPIPANSPMPQRKFGDIAPPIPEANHVKPKPAEDRKPLLPNLDHKTSNADVGFARNRDRRDAIISTPDHHKIENNETEMVELDDDKRSHPNGDIKSAMKRCSSTPNIAKECEKPFVDRLTKPQDDMLNYSYSRYNNNDSSSRPSAGLRNLGNTCYMNSIVQCLSNTVPLRESLSIAIQSINEKSKTHGAIAKELHSIFAQLWSGNFSVISCRNLKNMIGQYRDSFRGNEQQDSHEFLTLLLDWLHEDLNKAGGKNLSINGAIEMTGEKAWAEFKMKNHSLVQMLFYGQQKSTVTCLSCMKKSVTFEPFSNISLPILYERDECTLNSCIEAYLKEECITGYKCPQCKNSKQAIKKLDLTRLPYILVIHFKRFTVDGKWRVDTKVNFSDELNMRSHVPHIESRDNRYQLYAISNHFGRLDSGHYTAFCKNGNRWYNYDDEEARLGNGISIQSMRSSAYILFYQSLRDGTS